MPRKVAIISVHATGLERVNERRAVRVCWRDGSALRLGLEDDDIKDDGNADVTGDVVNASRLDDAFTSALVGLSTA